MRFISMMVISCVVLSGCLAQSGNSGVQKSDVGLLAGAAAGAAAGSNVGKGRGNIAAIAAGTLLGAYLGYEVGSSLDKADLMYQNQTAQRSLESSRTGATSTWQNPDSGVSGTFTPTKTITNHQGRGGVCREYKQSIVIDGDIKEAYGRACRRPDGTWAIVDL